MNVVTFETAKRLQAAGFPPPSVYDRTEFAYTKFGRLLIVEDFDEPKEEGFFAPTATDILKELEKDYFCLHTNGEKWSCSQFEINYMSVQYENPAEACAAAWLSIHNKTTNQ